jgi:energy-coupling factor transporter ATP-binding protein EcfA2
MFLRSCSVAVSDVLGLRWDDFVKDFRAKWNPGEHISVIAPTGAGKTTFVAGILGVRRFVLALDPKGGDETLAGLRYRRLESWPGERGMERILDEDARKSRPSRFIVGPVVTRGRDLPKLRDVCGKALDGAFDMGGWTVYVDELQVATDRRMMNLAGSTDKLLVAARSKGVSFVSSFQAPSWVPSSAMRQPTWIATSYTRDTDTVNRLAEILGRPKPEIRGALKGLDQYCWLVVGRDPRAPLIVTKPHKVAAPRATA